MPLWLAGYPVGVVTLFCRSDGTFVLAIEMCAQTSSLRGDICDFFITVIVRGEGSARSTSVINALFVSALRLRPSCFLQFAVGLWLSSRISKKDAVASSTILSRSSRSGSAPSSPALLVSLLICRVCGGSLFGLIAKRTPRNISRFPQWCCTAEAHCVVVRDLLQNLDNDNHRLPPFQFSVLPQERWGISSVGNLRFCTRCRLGSRAQHWNS